MTMSLAKAVAASLAACTLAAGAAVAADTDASKLYDPMAEAQKIVIPVNVLDAAAEMQSEHDAPPLFTSLRVLLS